MKVDFKIFASSRMKIAAHTFLCCREVKFYLLTVSSFPINDQSKEQIPHKSTNLFQCLILDPPSSIFARFTRYLTKA